MPAPMENNCFCGIKPSVGTFRFSQKPKFPLFLQLHVIQIKEKILTHLLLITYLGVCLDFQSHSSSPSLNKVPVTIFLSHLHNFIRQDAVLRPGIFGINLAKPSP